MAREPLKTDHEFPEFHHMTDEFTLQWMKRIEGKLDKLLELLRQLTQEITAEPGP